MSRLLRSIVAWLPLAGVVGAFAWSAIVIGTRHAEATDPDTITISIGHWQLESGVRDAFEQIADDYRREVNPHVRIVQQSIPESTYGQWASTQLMGGTAPDLIEIGKGLNYATWVSYQSRYCTPLTDLVGRPNPYNAGTAFADLPLRATYKDGMRSGYVEELQEYCTVPLSQFVVRIFYNRDLLRRLTGLETPPNDFEAFVRLCDEIRTHRDERGLPYTPIALSNTSQFWMWEQMLLDAPTYGMLRRADYNRDGAVATDELWLAFRNGAMSFDDISLRTKFAMLERLLPNFQRGFAGLQRDEAVFAFAQQRAVFMTTGTWDARSLMEQAKGRFEIGVMNFPVPGASSEWAGQFEGPIYDRPMVGIGFAVTRSSRHADVAVDFLRYISSKRVNEKFNRIVGWIPTIRDTEIDPLLKPFAPQLEGVYGVQNLFQLGGETTVKWAQLYSLYLSGQISAAQLAAQFAPFYVGRGSRDFDEVRRDWARNDASIERTLAETRGRALLAASTGDSASAQTLWVRYRLIVQQRALGAARDHAREIVLAQQPSAPTVGPYEYRPAALARVRATLATQPAAAEVTR